MNSKYIINKHKKLNGSVPISGAKNSVLALMAASLLASGSTVIKNVPTVILDVKKMTQIMCSVGSKISFEEKEHTIIIDNTDIDPTIVLKYEKTKELRASYYMMGAMLGRFRQCAVSLPGGCNIGCRPIDLHVKGFKALGADVELKDGNIIARAENLSGAKVYMDFSSVGATINTLLAAVLAEGKTVIFNSANEPHVVDVANMLNCMGADIVVSHDCICINGVKRLHAVEYTVIPDQIEAGTFLVAGAMLGDVTVSNVIPSHLDCITCKLEKMGCRIIKGDDYVRAVNKGRLKPTNIVTAPYPGFPTDMQPQFAAALGIADGMSTINETIFENRFLYIDEMVRLGADMRQTGNINIINGIRYYKPAITSAPDLRAGVALVLSCLTCGGQVLSGEYIDRGYEDFAGKLRSLGADIKETKVEQFNA